MCTELGSGSAFLVLSYYSGGRVPMSKWTQDSNSTSTDNTGKQTKLSQEHSFLEDLVAQPPLRQPWLQMFKPVLLQWGRGNEQNSPFLRIPLNCQVRESIPRNIPEGKYACQSRLSATSRVGSQQEMLTERTRQNLKDSGTGWLQPVISALNRLKEEDPMSSRPPA